MKSELNSRQWTLYNYLKEKGDVWTTQLEIASHIIGYLFNGKPSEFHDSLARQQMTKDIQKINNSGVIQKVIISSSKGIKLANKKEFEKYISGEFAAVFRKLKRVRIKAKKGGLDGQMRITFNKERDTIEAFIDEILKKSM